MLFIDVKDQKMQFRVPDYVAEEYQWDTSLFLKLFPDFLTVRQVSNMYSNLRLSHFFIFTTAKKLPLLLLVLIFCVIQGLSWHFPTD